MSLINSIRDPLKHTTKKRKKKNSIPTFFKRGTLPIVNDSSNGKSPRGGKCSNFPKTLGESFFNLVKDVSQLGSMVPSYPLIVKSSKFAKITCGRLCSSTMW